MSGCLGFLHGESGLSLSKFYFFSSLSDFGISRLKPGRYLIASFANPLQAPVYNRLTTHQVAHFRFIADLHSPKFTHDELFAASSAFSSNMAAQPVSSECPNC